MKRVLLISYYFPPAGGVSAQRILKFARYLPAHGYQPTILTVDPAFASYPALDTSLCCQVPASMQVVRTRAWDPFSIYACLQGKRKEDVVGIGFVKENQARLVQRIGRWIRGNVFLPDARVGWVPFALHAARRLVHDLTPDVIMTTGPPHSAHLIGRRLQLRLGLPWVADFRDPWTDYFFNANMLQTGAARSAIGRMERSVLTRADVVLSVSDTIGANLHRKAPLRRYETLPNGYDSADISKTSFVREDGGPFVITHVGTLTREQHAPGLLEAVTGLGPAVELRFVGHVHEDITRACVEIGLGDRTRVIPFVPHSEAVAHMQRADLLLVSIGVGPHSRGIVTGKVFEYLRTGVPVLGLGPLDGELAALLRATGGGKVYHQEDATGIEHFIRGLMAKTMRPKVRPEILHLFDRRVLAERLAAIFDEIL